MVSTQASFCFFENICWIPKSMISPSAVVNCTIELLLQYHGKYKRGKYVAQETSNQKIPRAWEDGMMMKKPVIRHTKKVPMRNQSILLRWGLLSSDTTMYISRGPQAHHSPQIAAGEATLCRGKIYYIWLKNDSKMIWKIYLFNYPRTSIQSPPQFKMRAKIVDKVPIETILNATMCGTFTSSSVIW